MLDKDTYFIRIYDTDAPSETIGIGECPLFRGLSIEDCDGYEVELSEACKDPVKSRSHRFSSIRFGFESALRTIDQPNPWRSGQMGIQTNGLIWMGDKETMASRIDEKLEAGFKVLKLKIGGIDFEDELDLLGTIRKRYSPDTLEIRLDANGSFTPDNALGRLGQLDRYAIHSLEQPIKAGQIVQMRDICSKSPIAIGLDEELIGLRFAEEAEALVREIRPQYLILKPSLCGGFVAADTYIDIAERLGIGWWCTSALESNIGLAAIADWVAAKRPEIPQGLGTGLLYNNNIQSPLEMVGQSLYYNPEKEWGSIESLVWMD